MKDVAQYECFYNLYKNKNKYANRWEIIGEKLIGGEGRGQRSTLCQKHEALSPVCGKPQVLVSSWVFFERKTAVSFGFEADDVVDSGLKEEINLLAAKFPPRSPPCCLLRFSREPNARVHMILGSLSTRVFETWTATGSEQFACRDSSVSQIFILIICNGEKILSNVNVVV